MSSVVMTIIPNHRQTAYLAIATTHTMWMEIEYSVWSQLTQKSKVRINYYAI